MNRAVFELHTAKVAAMLQGMQTVAWQRSVYALSLSLAACFLYWLNNWPCAQAGECVREIFISFHALGKARLALRCLSSIQTHWQSGLYEINSAACLWGGSRCIYCLWSMDKQPADKKENRISHQWMYMLFVKCMRKKRRAVGVRRLTGMQSRGDKLWQYFSVADLTVGDRAHLNFYCSSSATYALLYIPLYFKHIPPPHSAEHTAATLTFIDALRIHNVTGVWAGSRSNPLQTHDILMENVGRLTEVCSMNKGLINTFTEVHSGI